MSASETSEVPELLSPDVAALRSHVLACLGAGPFAPSGGWPHMGAALADSVLQAGMKYKTVEKRVRGLIDAWPDADTLSGFRRRIESEGLTQVLDWNGRKLDTISALASRLGGEVVDGHRIDTVADLRAWLSKPRNAQSLTSIKGVASKTANYLCSMAGLDEVAVDVHLRRFGADAGVIANSYADLRRVFVDTAGAMRVNPGGLDYAVWVYQSSL